MFKEVTQGRYVATISKNGVDDFLVILSRGGQCLPGMPSRHYSNMKRAETGAKAMFKKVGA
jgi:hypothetical protein